MKILYYDCFSGISGDMNLAAMVDLGVEKQYIIDELQKLHLSGYSIHFENDQRKGITGTRADVVLDNPNHSHHHSHPHAHPHSEGDHEFSNKKPGFSLTTNQLKPVSKEEAHSHDQNRNFSEIKQIINSSTLNDHVKELSIEIFHKIAVAEAHVHGKSIDEIHFHEVGAVDSIVDIVGAAICFDWLKPDKVISSPVQLGGGFVKCAHGTFPVPAPATLEILKGIPVKTGAVQVETTTPTGAAIIATLANEFTDQPGFSMDKVAYGIGHRDNVIPNVLRVCMANDVTNTTYQDACIIECNIDDMNPEIYEYVMDKLFDAGADDVWFQPIIMKKTRPAITIRVLSGLSTAANLEQILLTETSTLGVRKYQVQKRMLQRNSKTIDTKWGSVSVKIGYLDGKAIKSKPEYNDCLLLSKKNNVPINDVYKEITRILNSEISDCN
jgi:hypothetical protein